MVRKAHGNDTVDVTVTIVHETERAYLVSDGKVKEWVAKDLVEMELDPSKKTYTCTMPMWLAEQKGLV
jgi:hypothetical protein